MRRLLLALSTWQAVPMQCDRRFYVSNSCWEQIVLASILLALITAAPGTFSTPRTLMVVVVVVLLLLKVVEY